jgi:hypothetical protein
MGQYFSLQTLIKAALGRPYIDVFEEEEEEEEEEDKKAEREPQFESTAAPPNVVLRLSKNRVRRVVKFEEEQ